MRSQLRFTTLGDYREYAKAIDVLVQLRTRVSCLCFLLSFLSDVRLCQFAFGRLLNSPRSPLRNGVHSLGAGTYLKLVQHLTNCWTWQTC